MIISKAREHELIRAAKAGDGKAVEGLIRAHQEAVYAFILRLSGRPHIAEDIVQEAFVRVLKNLDRFDPRFRFSTWLFTIARRLYVNAMQKHRPAYDTDTVSLRAAATTPPPGVSARGETMDNIRELLDTALEVLNDQQREIVLLFHQQSWPITEIAAHLDMPEGTVKSHLHRARRRMRRAIMADEVRHARAQEAWS
ncbi:MAG: sigma-70 family RNA polymerase sigma factor [Planctomycetes bacterium]|nr:sigma-70 family RNA polymerase sigma factor [Planctomycetota bacterium]